MTRTTAFEIVWRNPKPPKREQRWEQIMQDSGTVRYLVEELVFTSVESFWINTSSLEVVPGGRVA
ncbi:MAG TPA: hypothetical protein VLL05_03800 [Terriglobales bacterium]|nr:hypothetical protein [Terriglobales bacterium]